MFSANAKKCAVALLVICGFFCPTAEAASAAATQNWIKYADTSWYNKSKKEFTISKPEQLAGLAKLVNSKTASMKGKTVKLGKDIDLSGKDWTPIGVSLWITGGVYEGFAGTFDGCGKTITGMRIGSAQKPEAVTQHVGLFGAIRDGAVKNLRVQGTIYSSRENATIGGLAAQAEVSAFTNCSFKGDLHSSKAPAIGGLLGTSYDSTNGEWIKNCSAEGTVEGGYRSYLGGLAGMLGNMAESSWSAVTVIGHDSLNVGGFAGYYCGARINRCFSTGPVSGGIYTAGFIGNIQGNNQITSNHWINNYITNCFSAGAVSASGSLGANLGGFAGWMLQMNIVNCYSSGNVTGVGPNSQASGFAAWVGGNSKAGEYSINNCYSSGAIDLTDGDPENISGVSAYTCFDFLTNVFWNTDFTTAESAVHENFEGASRLQNLTGKTSDEMKSKAFVDLLNKNKSSIKGLPKDIVLADWEQSDAVNDGFPFLAGVGPVKN
jgi:hypothetical protein